MSTRSTFRIPAYNPSAPSSRQSKSSPPQVVVAEKPPVAGSESPRSSRSSNSSASRKKRSRSDQKGPQQRIRKRKNCTDVDERRRQLEADPWTLEVRSRIVRCLGCKRWIKLDQRNEYYSGLWAKHRDLCRGVKMMKGEALPKRTRRSKKKSAVATVANSVSAAPATAANKASTTPETVPVQAEILSTCTDSPTPTEYSNSPSTPDSLPPSPELPPRASLKAFEAFTPTDRTSSSYSPPLVKPSYPYPRIPDPRPADTTSSRFHYPQYVPYNYGVPYHLAYYPVAQSVKLPPISEVTKNRSPSPDLYESDIGDDNMDVDADDAERFAFAPADECRGHHCRPRFRYSTQHEIRTYFDGATLDSMAQSVNINAVRCSVRRAQNLQKSVWTIVHA
ncbi:hypothetical protein E4T56_gene5149 [Termitomyces sp. T112]|nr:hypothetical protein E4T56_gene5149 [Termitomyces sp. T112]